MNNEIALKEHALSPEDKTLLRDTLVRGLTDKQFDVFMNIAKGLQLNPFKKEIYGTVVQGRLVTIVGIDGFRKIAHRTGAYAGMDPIDVEYDGDSKIVAATAKVYKFVQNTKVEFNARVLFTEYFRKGKSGRPSNWESMPYTMICKVVEAHALRRGFPELGGVFTPEEMDQAHDVPESNRTKEINANLENMETPEAPEYNPDVEDDDVSE